MTTEEEWRTVANAPYEVSSLGRIRRSGRILKPFAQRAGYLLVKLSVGGVAANALVHRLVAAAFLGEPMGREVDHVDGSKPNNAVTNLEYVTPSENMRRAIATGLHSGPRPTLDYGGHHWTQRDPSGVQGERNGRAKLTDSQVSRMRERASLGETQSALARAFGVSTSLAHNIIRRKAWAHT